MEIKENVMGTVSQVLLEGRFDADTSETVEQFLRERIEKGIHRFVLDMEKVSFIASAGLRVVLVYARELRQKHQGDLRISSLQPNVKKVFEISGLNSVLRVFDDADTASGSFL